MDPQMSRQWNMGPQGWKGSKGAVVRTQQGNMPHALCHWLDFLCAPLGAES